MIQGMSIDHVPRPRLHGLGVAGMPVIASNVSGLNEIVRGAGCLFEVGDFEALSEAVLKLLKTPSLYAEAAEKCRERAEQYDVKYMIEGYERVYASVCN